MFANKQALRRCAITRTRRDQLAEDIGAFRRALIPEVLISLTRGLRDGDFSLLQIGTLYVLDAEGSTTVKALADRVGRSVSATSRLIDGLLARGLVDRREDEQDRRLRRVALTTAGSAFLRGFERSRADAQREVMAHLTDEEQQLVTHAMTLLADAARRRQDAHPTRPDPH